MRSSKNKNPCFDCLASEKENEEVCRTIRAILNKHNSVQVDLNDPGSIGTLTIGDCTFNVYLGGTTLNRLTLLPGKDVYKMCIRDRFRAYRRETSIIFVSGSFI